MSPLSRRRFLAGSAALGASAAACSAEKGIVAPVPSSTTPTSVPSPPTPEDDARTASLAAGLEILAIRSYLGAIQIVNAGQLPPPPSALAMLVNVAVAQHQQHVEAWNNFLRQQGRPEVTEPDPQVSRSIHTLVQGTHSTGLALMALTVEELVAANYVSAIPNLAAIDAIALAGSVHVVETGHAAVLRFLLDRSPPPGAFAGDALSLPG